MDNKVAFNRECCFPNDIKIMVNKVTFVGFKGAIATIAPPWIRPCIQRS